MYANILVVSNASILTSIVSVCYEDCLHCCSPAKVQGEARFVVLVGVGTRPSLGKDYILHRIVNSILAFRINTIIQRNYFIYDSEFVRDSNGYISRPNVRVQWHRNDRM